MAIAPILRPGNETRSTMAEERSRTPRKGALAGVRVLDYAAQGNILRAADLRVGETVIPSVVPTLT